MTAPAWMPLYIADYLADTGHLTTVEHGAYMLLIMHYWQHGGLPADEHKLARITRMSIAEWSASRDTLADLFEEGWKHGRIDKEIAAARETMNKRSAAGRAGASARYGKRTAIAMANALQTNAPAGDGVCLVTSQSGQTEEDGGSARDEFAEAFWPAWPEHVGEVVAREAFAAARERASLDEILAGLERYKAAKPARQYWMTAERFLSEERWRDEHLAAAAVVSPPTADVVWLDEDDPRWGKVAGMYRERTGQTLIPTTSKHANGGFGAFLKPADYPELSTLTGA